MIISNKSLTIIIAALCVSGLGFVVFDSPEKFNERSVARSLNSDYSQESESQNIMQGNEYLLENIDVLNQEILILRQNQKRMSDKMDELVSVSDRMDELVSAFEKLDVENNYTSLQENNLTLTDGNTDIFQISDKEIIQMRNEAYESNLTSQEIDSVWREQAHEKIESLIEAQESAGSSIVSVDCRDTLCKLDLAHADQSSAENFLEEFPAHMAWNNESFIETEIQIDGSIRTMVYFSRDGESLPATGQGQDDI